MFQQIRLSLALVQWPYSVECHEVVFGVFFLINHIYSYSDYLAYDERPHLHAGYPTPMPVPASHEVIPRYRVAIRPGYSTMPYNVCWYT